MAWHKYPNADPSKALDILRPIRGWDISNRRHPTRSKQSDHSSNTKNFRPLRSTGEEKLMLLPFPQDLPIEGVGILIDRLRGKPIPLTTALNAAWNLAGYAATQVPLNQPVTEVNHTYPVSDAEVITLLEMIKGEYQNPPEGSPIKFAVIPWGIVLKVLIKFLINAAF